MKKIVLKAYLYWALSVFAVVMLVAAPFIVLPYLFGTRTGAKFSYPVMRIWAAAFIFPIAGIYFRVKGRNNIAKGQAYVYVANHNSLLDTPALIFAVPNPMQPLGKTEMTKIPFFGLLYSYMVVLVDRSSAASRRASLQTMKDRLAMGISVLLFPEGTMNKGSEPMQAFYDGAFHLAIEAQVPLLPIVLTGTKKLLPPSKSMKLLPGVISVQILNPIITKGLQQTDVSKLKEQTRALMLEKLTAKLN